LSVTMEETGIIGLIIILLLFTALIMRGIQIANKCDDPLAIYMSFGIVFMISIQAGINMGVALGILPVTGLTLPFISYGGSSLITTYAGIGILMNISGNKMARSRRRYEEFSGSRGRDRRARIPGSRPGGVHTTA